VRGEDFIKMAVDAVAVFDLMRFARLMGKRAIGIGYPSAAPQ
jgi:hypothetical protein